MGVPSTVDQARSQILTDAVRVSISGTTARSTALPSGMYLATSDVECRIKQGGSTITVTTSTGIPLWSKGYLEIYVDATTDAYIAGITTGATGTLELCKVS